MKKNLVFFTETTGIGGAEVYLKILALNLDKEQFDISVAIPKNEGTENFVNEMRSKGISVEYIKRYNFLSNYLYFKKNKPDIIHFNVPFPIFFCCTIAILAGSFYSRSKLFATIHLAPPDYRPNLFFRSIINFIYRKLAVLITVSNKNKKALITNFDLPEDQIKVIYNCVNIDSVAKYNKEIAKDLKDKFSINDSAIVFGTVGRLHKQKGHQYLIEASKKVIEKVPNSIFLFVGTGSEKDRLVHIIEENNIKEHFRFVGFQEDLPEILALIDIFVLPSISEGLPFALLEAMAARKPVIATNVGGVPEIITDHYNGIVVEPRDANGLANAMILLAKDENKRDQMAQMGYTKIIDTFSIEKMIKMTEQIYKEY
ncbi:MAG: glycosyltransferase family 4 protein [Candidatus Methanoperedens sp.]|nr:glycosyltransferase family 4 protein [Candidatus Methanoperedens sp.]